MTSTSDLITVMKKSIQIIESSNFDPILYQAIGLLYEYAGRHSGVTSQVLSSTRPSFQKSEVNNVIASGWLEEMTSPSEGSKQVVWKEALVVLTQKQGEEPCLWISREIMEGGNEPELETIHKIFTRRLHSYEYVNFYGDHRVSLRARRKDNDIILRCQSASAARAWVNELDAAKAKNKRASILSRNFHSPSRRERSKSQEKRVLGGESVKQKKEKADKEIEQKGRKWEKIENVQAAADSRRRREIELEEQKKAAAEKRRIDIEQKRKIAQEEQKRIDAEKKQIFLAEEQRKQDLIANAKKGKVKSTKTEEKQRGKEGEQTRPKVKSRRSSLSAASKYQKVKQQQQQDLPRETNVRPNSENKSSSAHANEEHSAQTEADIKYTEMANQVTRNGEEFLTTIKRSILSQWALQPPLMQSLRPLEDLLCNIHTVYPPAFGVPSHSYFTNWHIITSEELVNTKGTRLEEEKVKKAVRKLRFFLHPDKLPRDLNEEQQFICKLLWDVTNDAWDEYKKTQEDVNLLR